MTPLELIRDMRAAWEARRTYDRAVERHFVHAHRLVAEGRPDAAEAIAKGAVALRQDAHYELEGRPMSGLDVERLARAMHDEGVCEDWSPGFRYLDKRDRVRLRRKADHAAHVRQAERIAAAYDAAGPTGPTQAACTCLSVGSNLVPSTINCPRHGNWTYTGSWT